VAKLKPAVQITKKGKLFYIVEDRGRVMKFRPWLGDSFAFLYDFIMRKSVFPKKFGGDIETHYEILTEELAGVHNKQVLELGTGSGSAVHFLKNENRYTGTDISPGLLKQAANRFLKAGFPNPEFYVVSADDLPFAENIFDVCLCILSLNFIGNVKEAFRETNRVLRPNGMFVCSVPVPERNRLGSKINGVLYSETELEKISRETGFHFEPISCDNGALLYFRARKAN